MIGKKMIGSILLPLLAAGCTADAEWTGQEAAGGTAVRLSVAGMTGQTATDKESQLNEVRAWRFANGVLEETAGPLAPEADGTCYLKLAEPEGTLCLLANTSQLEGLEALKPGVTTLEEFKALAARTEEMTARGLLMGGQAELDGQTDTELAVSLTRSVARIGLSCEDKGVEVLQVRIGGIADRGFAWAQEAVALPAQAGKGEFRKTYDTPLANGSETLLYVCEQPNGGMTAEVLVRFGEALHRMEAPLPAVIRRNTAYTVHVYGLGDSVSLGITQDGWENGATSGTVPVHKALVDTAASALPAGVRVNPGCDSVFVASTGGDFRLVLNGESGTEVAVEGSVDNVAVQMAAVRGLQAVAGVTVSAGHRMPGSVWEYIHLNLHRGQTLTGRVVLAFAPNPVKIEGRIVLDKNGTCDFGRYVEGELGRLTLPEGKLASVEADAGEPAWIKLVKDGEAYRILGGWKPNDPKADGRKQEARLVIGDADGGNRETYVIRRVNWGLPVVEIDGRWWCKYNLKGNVKDFADQVGIAADRALGRPLAEHLASCSDSELLALMGGQYQAGRPDELPLRYDGNVFRYEGFSGSVQDWGDMEATQMTPEGYELPDYDAYAFFGWGNNSNIGGVGTRTYRNGQGREITVTVTERDARFLGGNYGTVAFYDFEYGGNHWTLYGLGHQWDATAGNIARMMILLATTGSTGSSWYMEGYAQADRPGQNWLKFTAQNARKTRTIRCVKTPVEYMYD